jgi:hypothetical protein
VSTTPLLASGLGVIAAGIGILARVTFATSRRLSDLAERIAHLEGKANGTRGP